MVEPGIFRSGHCTEPAQWEYLRSLGVVKAIKLDLLSEDTDAMAAAFGIAVEYHPVSLLQQLLVGPNDKDFRSAVAGIKPGTIVHCKNGWDRTGLACGCWRIWYNHWPKENAYQEMLRFGFHRLLLGLSLYWAKA
jgi:protein tyrosine/serine phosphatase